MKISRTLAITILKYLHNNPDFYFPFLIVCQEYTPEDDDFVEIEAEEWIDIKEDKSYQTFELWENLQDLREDTTELLAKGFIEKILDNLEVKKFIFLTFEGFTQEPNLKDIENIQMLGISEGKTSKEAFENLIQQNNWLLETSFNELYCHELKNNNYEFYNLK